MRLSQEIGIDLVATNDVHYTYAEDVKPHDILLCIQTGKKLADEDRMRYEGGQYYIKSEEEMKQLFPYALQALENTQKIADRCNVEIEFGVTKLPKYDVPEGYTSWEYLNKLCFEGLERLYHPVTEELRERLDHQERQDRREYSLTIAGAAGAWYLSQIEPVKVAALVDHIFLMGYDLHGTWNSRTGLNAPLNPVSHASQAGGSIAGSVQAYLERGVPAEKIVLGTPLYGYLYQGVSSRNNGLYSTYTSGKSISYQTLKKTYLASSAYRQFRHEEGQGPYLYGNGTFLSYDDAASIAAKASLARSLGLGGVGFWELSQDSGGELVSAAVQALHSSWDNPFRDVLPGVWYEDAVRYVYEREMMQGTSASAFSPNTSSNRGMLTAILYRLEGSPRSGEPPFTDVAADAYYGQAVAWAEKHGIVQGFDDGTFRPGARITRQQLAAVLFRYADFKGEAGRGRADLSAYQDGNRVEVYAREAMAWAVDAGLIQGLADGRLDPGGTATRAQTAVILQRLCEQVLEA